MRAMAGAGKLLPVKSVSDMAASLKSSSQALMSIN